MQKKAFIGSMELAVLSALLLLAFHFNNLFCVQTWRNSALSPHLPATFLRTNSRFGVGDLFRQSTPFTTEPTA
jgi:hypothetical protein